MWGKETMKVNVTGDVWVEVSCDVCHQCVNNFIGTCAVSTGCRVEFRVIFRWLDSSCWRNIDKTYCKLVNHGNVMPSNHSVIGANISCGNKPLTMKNVMSLIPTDQPINSLTRMVVSFSGSILITNGHSRPLHRDLLVKRLGWKIGWRYWILGSMPQ